MEERFETIGEGWSGAHPYDVRIYWNPSPESEIPNPIALAEGSGHAAMGSIHPLADVLNERWTDHLQKCGCLWLRELAREEQARGRYFSPDEIYARWQARALTGSR